MESKQMSPVESGQFVGKVEHAENQSKDRELGQFDFSIMENARKFEEMRVETLSALHEELDKTAEYIEHLSQKAGDVANEPNIGMSGKTDSDKLPEFDAQRLTPDTELLARAQRVSQDRQDTLSQLRFEIEHAVTYRNMLQEHIAVLCTAMPAEEDASVHVQHAELAVPQQLQRRYP